MSSAPVPRLSAARRAIRRFIGHTWLSVFGWRVEGVTELPRKAVLVAAPHTSNWDFPFTLAVSYVLDLEFSWLGKHTLFEPPFGFFFRWLGGIPVDRRDRNNLVAAVVEVLKQRDELILVVAPEGTRSRTGRWKTGFYYVALGAGVPILLGYLDFPRKRGGILHVFQPTGDIEADMAVIRRHYESIGGKHPSRMSEITLGPGKAQVNGAAQHP
ncbi:acyltransferase [Sorangium cellulosum]|uniref:Acyltransferase n=1 Tax=Sorangium cellulosum TaxID=56 RepID=A0A4V0NCV9_SORCE|nr:lysophospholipid acyltransferase family protein [Sorangium cellulosum]AUX20532.1 acyltransferase [Sorangium cellulosum]